MMRASKATILVLGLGMAACDCSDPPTPPPPPGPCNDMCMPAVPPATIGSLCCETTDMCVDYDAIGLCEPGFVCNPANVSLDTNCTPTCSMCERAPALEPGLLASHLDMVVTESGTIMMSGFSAGNPPRSVYGDLVIGPFDPAAMTAEWDIIDGAPTGPITNDPEGWRGGVSDPGEDVGRWTSIAEANGTYYVAYYDKTNTALKIAIGTPDAFSTYTIDDAGDSGRYSSIVIDSTGNPVISYLRMQRSTTDSTVSSSVMIASATSATPASPTDWVLTVAASAPMPCRPGLCADGESCLEDSGLCANDTGDCGAACADDEICYMASCQVELPSVYIEDMPPAYGMYTSLARTTNGLALVYYDRTAGDLLGARFVGGAWEAPFLIDGYSRRITAPAVGDSGIGASLFVDSTDVWHVTYVDGAEETLRYARVEGGAVALWEIIDDGSGGATRHPDGRHIVGDDSSVVVTDSGEVRVAYQDATSTSLLFARRTGPGEWTIETLDPGAGSGYWAEQVLSGGTSYVATFWQIPPMGMGGVRLFMMP
jgi:hypothetical protein